VVVVALCGITLVLGYINKEPHGWHGRKFDGLRPGACRQVRPAPGTRTSAYSDIQQLWIGPGTSTGTSFPYVNGEAVRGRPADRRCRRVPGADRRGDLGVSALFAHTDADFLLLSALLLAPFGLFTALEMLARLSGCRSLYGPSSPLPCLYAFHNWELPVVLCAVAASTWCTAAGADVGGTGRCCSGPRCRRPARLGFTFKIYPAIFVLPLMLYVLTGVGTVVSSPAGCRPGARLGRVLWRIAVVALGTAIAVNLPFVAARVRRLGGVVRVPVGAQGPISPPTRSGTGFAARLRSDNKRYRT